MNVDIEYTTSYPARRNARRPKRAGGRARGANTKGRGAAQGIAVGPRTLSDLEMISTGVFSPLTGFMVREDYESVVDSMRLANGLVWSMPITLSVSEDEAREIGEARR